MKALKVVKRVLFFLLKFAFIFISELLHASIKADKKEVTDKTKKFRVMEDTWNGLPREFEHKL